jgi:hypothetical protein
MHESASLKQNVQSWGVMILPVKTFDLMIELRGVIGPSTHVKYSIISAVPLH